MRKNGSSTVVYDRLDRSTVAVVSIFAIPPAVGTALAAYRVTDGESWLLGVAFGSVVGIAVAAFVALLVVSGEVDADYAE